MMNQGELFLSKMERGKKYDTVFFIEKRNNFSTKDVYISYQKRKRVHYVLEIHCIDFFNEMNTLIYPDYLYAWDH